MGKGSRISKVGAFAITPAIWSAAVAEANKKGANIAQIAQKYRIKRTTLSDRVKSGKVGISIKGPPPVLGQANEKLIHDHLLDMADSGYALSITGLQCFARSVAAAVNIPTSAFNASDEWAASFMRRHPDLSNRKAKKVNGARIAKFNRIIVQKWFKVWEAVSAQYTPAEIVNADDKHLNSEELVGTVR